MFACTLVRARTRITLADCAARFANERASERIVGTGRKRPEDRVQVYKGSWKGGDLPRSPFIRTAAFSVSLPSSFILFLLRCFSDLASPLFLFSLSLDFLSCLFLRSSRRHPSPYFLFSRREKRSYKLSFSFSLRRKNIYLRKFQLRKFNSLIVNFYFETTYEIIIYSIGVNNNRIEHAWET